MTAENDNHKPRLMSPKEAALETSLSAQCLHIMSENGEFPGLVRISTRRIAFVRDEVEEWIEERIARRAA